MKIKRNSNIIPTKTSPENITLYFSETEFLKLNSAESFLWTLIDNKRDKKMLNQLFNQQEFFKNFHDVYNKLLSQKVIREDEL